MTKHSEVARTKNIGGKWRLTPHAKGGKSSTIIHLTARSLELKGHSNSNLLTNRNLNEEADGASLK
jgi:hypothetical protein